MKRKEKIIGSLIISVIAILFLFIGYSKTNDYKISMKKNQVQKKKRVIILKKKKIVI